MYEPISSQINSAWMNVELSDLLLLYKKMVLVNWKELSECMSQAGWERNDDHCRHEV